MQLFLRSQPLATFPAFWAKSPPPRSKAGLIPPAKLPGEVAVPVPPLHVRRFLKKLPQLAGVDGFLSALRPLLQRVAVVTRRRRAAMLAGCIAFPLVMVLATFCISAVMTQWNHHNPDIVKVVQVLDLRSEMKRVDANQSPVPTDRQFAIYIAGHYRAAITNNNFWSSILARVLVKNEERRFAQESITQYPAPTESELAGASAALMLSRSAPGFSLDDIKDLSVFTDRLQRQSDPVSAFLWQSLSNQDRTLLANYQAGTICPCPVLQVLDRIAAAPCLYEADRFKDVSLRPETICPHQPKSDERHVGRH